MTGTTRKIAILGSAAGAYAAALLAGGMEVVPVAQTNEAKPTSRNGCETCRHKHTVPLDFGHCYMFRDEPGVCRQHSARFSGEEAREPRDSRRAEIEAWNKQVEAKRLAKKRLKLQRRSQP